MPLAVTSIPLRIGAFSSVSAVFGAGLAAISIMHTPAPDPFGGAPVFDVFMVSDSGMNAPALTTTASAPPPSAHAVAKPVPASALVRTVATEAKTHEPLPTAVTQPARTETSNTTEGTATSQATASGPSTTPRAQAAQTGGDTSRGSEHSGASAQASDDDYMSTVIRWIDQHKSHPGRVNGIVTLDFVVDRRGRLRQSRISQSSGDPRLDQLALSQLRAAAPLPRPPHDITWTTRQMQVRLDYRRHG